MVARKKFGAAKSSTEHNIINKQQDIKCIPDRLSFISFHLVACLLNCLHRLALNVLCVLYSQLLYSFTRRSERVYALFLGCNLFVKYPRKKVALLFCQISSLQQQNSVQFPPYAMSLCMCVCSICSFNKPTKMNRTQEFVRRNFAKQTNILQKFVNNDDFHDYVVNINFDRVHGVEFLRLDDPQCSNYANIPDTEFEKRNSKNTCTSKPIFIYALYARWVQCLSMAMFVTVCMCKNP